MALAAMPALAQNAGNAVRVVATVDKVDGQTLVAKTDDGATETFALAPNVLVFANKKATVHDIKAGDYVASAAVKGTDGKLHSTELRIFPEAMRGLGEGQRPMNDARNQTMTNATVTGVAMVGQSGDVKVKLPNTDSELVVDPGVPVTAIVPAEKTALKAGDKIQINGNKNPDGSQTAARIIIQ
jgi:hypothetical protein